MCQELYLCEHNPKGGIITLILQVTKMKFREVKYSTQAHTASKL